MTLEELVDEFESKVTADPNINTFVFNDLETINELHATDYPLLLLNPTQDSVDPRADEMDYNINMYLLDTYYQDDAKTLRQKFSDMQIWGIDLIQEMYEVSEIKNVENISVDRGQDQYNDNLIVVQFDFTIRVYDCMSLLEKPTDLTATAASSSQIDLTWNDRESAETGYEVARSTDLVSWTTVTTTAADATSFSDTGLTASTTYFYKVRAVNAASRSAYSDFKWATTSA